MRNCAVCCLSCSNFGNDGFHVAIMEGCLGGVHWLWGSLIGTDLKLAPEDRTASTNPFLMVSIELAIGPQCRENHILAPLPSLLRFL